MRFITILAGAVLLVLGLISLVTPIPGGTLAITLGAGLIICASQTATDYIRASRSEYLRFNEAMIWLESKMGQRLSRPLRMTRPDERPLHTDNGGME